MAHVNSLVGGWKITAFQVEPKGSEWRNIYDEHPSGYLIMSGEGRMTTLLTAGQRAPDAPSYVLFKTLNGYSGRYRFIRCARGCADGDAYRSAAHQGPAVFSSDIANQ